MRREVHGRSSPLLDHLAILRRCREVGVAQAFRERAAEAKKRVERQRRRRRPLDALLRQISDLESPVSLSRRSILCEQALSMVSREGEPVLWAELQIELGASLANDPLGDRIANLEQAIVAYRSALDVLTRLSHPERWARTMIGLASVYLDSTVIGFRTSSGPSGTVREALNVFTTESDRLQWAMATSHLGHAYVARLIGDRSANLEQAIDAYGASLQVLGRDESPVEWARIMNNLGGVYAERVLGGRSENLERAVVAYEAALEVFTPGQSPVEWARIMNNLGGVYAERVGVGQRTWSRRSSPMRRRWRSSRGTSRRSVGADHEQPRWGVRRAGVGGRSENLERAVVA